MDIVILGAIPHRSVAKESMAYLEKEAPFFTRLLQTYKASTEWLDIDAIGCTPYEYFQLRQAGCTSPFLASGLGPLYCPSSLIPCAQQKIYLMALTHIEIGQHHASLFLPEELAITPEQSFALFESARTVFEHSPYQLQQYHPDYFLIDMGEYFDAPLLSTHLMATGYLNDWWRDKKIDAPLRNLLSELQMAWHHHAVNRQRTEQGLKAINNAWIFGGARAADLPLRHKEPQTHNINDLAVAHRQQDWGMWLMQLGKVEHALNTFAHNAHRFILCGFDRLVTLTPKTWLQKTLNPKHEWKKWWLQSL